MNAVDVLKQSVNFYKNLFTELTTLGLYISGVVFINETMQYMGMGNGLFSFLTVLTTLFGSMFLVLYVDQFARHGARDFSPVFAPFKAKLWPYIKTLLLLFVLALICMLPVVMIISLLVNHKLIAFMLAGFAMVLLIWAVYRLVLFTNVVLLSDESGMAALQRSSDLAKANPLLLNALVIYIGITFLISLPEFFIGYIWGRESFQSVAYQSLINVFLVPFGTVYVYRLYILINEQRPLQVMTLDFAEQTQPPQAAAENTDAAQGVEPNADTANSVNVENTPDDNKPEPK